MMCSQPACIHELPAGHRSKASHSLEVSVCSGKYVFQGQAMVHASLRAPMHEGAAEIAASAGHKPF